MSSRLNCICSDALAGIPAEISGIDLISGAKKSFFLKQPKLGTVVVFLSCLCPCSHSHIPTLEKLFEKFNSEGFAFLGVHSNSNETPAQAGTYFKNLKLSFPIIQDQGAQIADQLEAYKTPHVFVISPNLQILFQGGVDDSRIAERVKHHFLEDALLAIRDGKTPSETNVRVLGCEIRRP